MKHAPLFAGINGFGLAADAMGWEQPFHCEIDEFCQRVIQYYWPKSKAYYDIKKTDFTQWRGSIDVLSGGFPCQDASGANQSETRRQGIEGDRTGLAFETLRAMSEIRPGFGVFENVPGLLTTNDGRDFRTIITELARMGYNAEWRICRASEVGAPHHRARLFVVAYPNRIRLQAHESFFSNVFKEASQARRNITGTTASVGISWDNEPGFTWVDDGISNVLDEITVPNWRKSSVMSFGNAVVPNVVFKIFQSIKMMSVKKS